MKVRFAVMAHRDGKESRTVPLLFPKVREYLEDARDLAGELAKNPATPVIRRYRSANANLRTQLQRIIKRAGLKSWPKILQNLRATRETEFAETFPIHVVCEWIGNSQATAKKHYLQATEKHLSKARKAQQKTQQSATGRAKMEWTERDANPQKLQENVRTPTKSGFSSGRHRTRTIAKLRAELEAVLEDNAESNALCQELLLIIDRWPTMLKKNRESILKHLFEV